ncbi:MAG: carboxypeptidase-like regulatory domain-containing protein [Patescibacteria group bacterium]|nr:carboxypeptidase-like regulatory domain-containing protein [Patescibacteria group bacterium]
MRTALKLILIAIALAIVALLGFLFFRFNLKEKLSDAYFNLTVKSQTMGAVTANRDSGKIKFTEITDAFWGTKTISPVIGKAYKIDRLKNDGRPVHVEFAYDPETIPADISPADLRLFKWLEENGKKYWSEVNSRVDTAKHIVTADLNAFSVLAIKAPVWLVLTEAEREDISKTLTQMQKNPPPFACGVIMTMEEELIAGESYYSRSGDENIEKHGCWNNGTVKSIPFNYSLNREENGKIKAYNAQALVEWQLDPQESITLDGWVVDQNGEAVENAQVIAQKTKYSPWEKKDVTDKNGYYKLKLHSGEYAVKVIGKDAKCPVVSAGSQFCLNGDIWEEPITRSRWQKNFTLKKCGKYELSITSKISSNTYHSEVHGSALVNDASDSAASSGNITIDKMATKLGKGGTCKQLRPFQYNFKAAGNNLTDEKNLSLLLDFSEQEEKELPEDAFCMSTILIPGGSPEAEAEIQASLAKARQYCDFECNYVSDYADFPGVEIAEDSWLFDFMAMHQDEGLNAAGENFTSIIEIKDWDIVGQGGVWARKTYQRQKQAFKQTYTEDTVLELKAIK